VVAADPDAHPGVAYADDALLGPARLAEVRRERTQSALM
jgi:hypothetical protein